MVGFEKFLLVVILSLALGHSFSLAVNQVQFTLAFNSRFANNTEYQKLKEEIAVILQETDVLQSEKLEITQKFNQSKQQCEGEVSDLNKSYQDKFETLNENQKVMINILKDIQEEEQEHIRLEIEMRKISEILELFELQHEVLFEYLMLDEKRRISGTAESCMEVTIALAKDAENSLQTRALLRIPFWEKQRNPNDMQMDLLANQLRMAQIAKDKVEGLFEISKKEYEQILEECNKTISNLKHLIEAANIALDTSSQSVLALENYLKESKEFSVYVQLEIETGKTYIAQLRKTIQKVREQFLNYVDDEACYRNIEEMDAQSFYFPKDVSVHILTRS